MMVVLLSAAQQCDGEQQRRHGPVARLPTHQILSQEEGKGAGPADLVRTEELFVAEAKIRLCGQQPGDGCNGTASPYVTAHQRS